MPLPPTLKDVQEYVSTEYNDGSELELLLESQMDDINSAADTQLPRLRGKTGENDEEKAMFREDYSEYRKREKLYEKNKRSLF